MIDPLWVVAKGKAAVTAAVAIHPHAAIAVVTNWLAYFAPTLKGFTIAMRALSGANLSFSLDI